ncbi:MAG: hypothetical protein O2807_13220 [bacterium]|nr:hypothetical protein [bacterium]
MAQTNRFRLRGRPAPPAFHAALLAILAILAGWPASPARAHHTSRIGYVLQRVGEARAGAFHIELISTPPLLPASRKGKETRADHKRLPGFTHRFQAIVKTDDDKSVSGLQVSIRFTQNAWSRTFPLAEIHGKGETSYAGNLTLGPKGPYAVRVILRPAAAAPLFADFSFEHDFESVKEVMREMEKLLAALGKDIFTLGLDGEIPTPGRMDAIREKIARLRGTIPWLSNLREGAAQERFDAEVDALLAVVKKMEATARRDALGELVPLLFSTRAACVRCHGIFQEADATGKLPKIPPAGKK